MDRGKVGVDVDAVEPGGVQQGGHMIGPRAGAEVDARQNVLVPCGTCGCGGIGRPAGQQPLDDPAQQIARDEIAVHHQQRAAGAQDAEPFGKGRCGFDQRPDQMTGDDHVHAGRGQRYAFGIGLDKGHIRQFGAGAVQHRFGPVQPRDGKAQAVTQARDLAGAGCQIQERAALRIA